MASLWCQGTERRMYDPGGNSEQVDRDDWCFLSENKRWKELWTGGEKADGKSEGFKTGGEGEWSNEEAEEGEQNEYRNKVEGENAGGVACKSKGIRYS